MSYNVRYTDSQNKLDIVVEDGKTNTETSLALPGRNQKGYSVDIAENFLHLLEHFASETSPEVPVTGQVWYDKTKGVEVLKVWDGTEWKAAGSVKKESTQPSGILGDLWVDTNNQQLYLFNGSTWILVGPTFSSGLQTGVQANMVTDSNGINRVILESYIDDRVVSIFSLSTFIPKNTIEGFTTIRPGINISSKDFTGDGSLNKFWGIAEKSESLLVDSVAVPSNSFLRKDIANVTDFGMTIRNDNGISTGSQGQLKFLVDPNQVGYIYHSTENSAFDLRINNNGQVITVLRVDSTSRVGIGSNNISPEETLDVLGTSRFTDIVKIISDENTTNDVTGALRVAGGINVQKDIIVRGNVTNSGNLNTSVLTVGKQGIDQAILPLSNNTYDIGRTGTNPLKFRNIYAGTFYGNLTGNVTGNVNGAANNLISSTRFKITGDIDASGFSFDGSSMTVSAGSFVIGTQYKILTIGTTNFTLIGAGSNTVGVVFTATGVGSGTGTATTSQDKIFNAIISPNFIGNQPELSQVAETDVLLIYRPSINQLRKAKKISFLKNVDLVPVGTILPFAGPCARPSDLPYGYLLCDGSEKRIASYTSLFAIIGYTYGAQASLQGDGTFRLPDLRGKFPLGLSTMDNQDTVPVNGIDTDSNFIPKTGALGTPTTVIGGSSGNEATTLTLENLPDHRHNLRGDQGTQFYAINNNSTYIEDTGSSLRNGTLRDSQNQYIDRTGTIVGRESTTNTTSAVNLMNPFLAINYIIYAGAPQG